MNKFQLLFLTTILIGCADPKVKTNVPEHHTETETKTARSPTGKPQTSIIKVPTDIDDKFDTFLKYFNEDSVFQVSRIGFPLKVKIAGPDQDYELTEKIIQKPDFLKLDFTYDPSNATEYEQVIEVQGDKATIGIRGIENGIMADYYFEKKNGKWKLITWIDAST